MLFRSAKVPLLGMLSFEDTSRPTLEGRKLQNYREKQLGSTAARWNSHVSALDIASVVNAFCMFVFSFLFSFIIPFLPGSPSRVFDPPGNSFFFTCPCFCLNCL